VGQEHNPHGVSAATKLRLRGTKTGKDFTYRKENSTTGNRAGTFPPQSSGLRVAKTEFPVRVFAGGVAKKSADTAP